MIRYVLLDSAKDLVRSVVIFKGKKAIKAYAKHWNLPDNALFAPLGRPEFINPPTFRRRKRRLKK